MSIIARPAAKAAGLFFAAALLFVLPAAGRADIFEAHEFTLPNGLDVVVAPNHLSPVVVQAVVYKAGAADGLPGKNGIAHFLEHLMFKGTKTLAQGQFSKEVDKRGGSDNANNGKPDREARQADPRGGLRDRNGGWRHGVRAHPARSLGSSSALRMSASSVSPI